MSDVRDRWGGARVVAALGMGAAWAAAIHFDLRARPPDRFLDPWPLYVAAAAAGLFAGWRHLGVRLGRSMVEAVSWAVGAAFLALIYFSLLLAFKATMDTYSFTHFSTAMDLLDHLVQNAVDRFMGTLRSPIAAYVLIGSMGAGVASEGLHRVWR